MALSFDPTYPFLGLLLAYMVYSEWARLDSRYLVGASLLLLVITAVVDAAGQSGAANTLAVYVFYLLAGGVFLLLVDHVREERARARAERTKRPGEAPSSSDGSSPKVEAAGKKASDPSAASEDPDLSGGTRSASGADLGAQRAAVQVPE